MTWILYSICYIQVFLIFNPIMQKKRTNTGGSLSHGQVNSEYATHQQKKLNQTDAQCTHTRYCMHIICSFLLLQM